MELSSPARTAKVLWSRAQLTLSRDRYFAHGMDYGPVGDVDDVLDEGHFKYERRRSRHEWNKQGSIIEQMVTEREQAALQSLIKYGRVFGRWQNDARKTYFLPSYNKSKIKSDIVRDGKFEKWAYEQKEAFTRRANNNWHDLRQRLVLWTRSFKAIEGYFGTGVVAYFVFLRWLVKLNVYICLLMVVFVIIPQIFFTPQDVHDVSLIGNISTEQLLLSKLCSKKYEDQATTQEVPNMILDLLQGTGWMERTVMFFGYYSDTKLYISKWGGSYNMPLAYLLVVLGYIIISLTMMVRHTAQGIKERIIAAEDKYFLYGSLVFASWDCSMADPHSSVLKHRSIYNEIVAELVEQKRVQEMTLLDSNAKLKLLGVRILLNLFVIVCLVCAGFLIYFATNLSTQFTSSSDFKNHSQILRLLAQYVPSLTITFLNFLIPTVFQIVVMGEQLNRDTEILITLGRTVFLRMASLAVLIFTIYIQVTCEPENECNVGTGNCPEIWCWETYVGQQVYKLVVLDFFTVFFLITLVQYPRSFVVKHSGIKAIRILGKPEFQIPRNVLDLVYSQSLCWFGAFFSPLIPLICLTKCFLFFYLKKATCIHNHVPTAKPYRASRLHAFFMMVLLTTFLLICIPIGYIVWIMTPSKSCGPFRAYTHMHEVVGYAVQSTYPIVRGFVYFLFLPGFVVPLVMLLCVLTYYFVEISKANNFRTTQLQEQLIMEGKDKQYLLSRIDHLTCRGITDPRDVANNYPISH